MQNHTYNITKVSSTESSKFTTDTRVDIDYFLSSSTTHDLYMVSVSELDGNLMVNAICLGDVETLGTVSVYDIDNDCTIECGLETASTHSEMKNFIQRQQTFSLDTSIYLVKASRELNPSYDFIALSAIDNEDRIHEVNDYNTYYLQTGRACIDFIANASHEEIAC